MKMTGNIWLAVTIIVMLLAACADTEHDYCKYLSLGEAQEYDAAIVKSEMRQTKRILYCVWSDGASDRLFISLDRALEYSPADFLKVVAKNSPEENERVDTIPGLGKDAAALFLGDGDELNLEFLIAQNSKYSITIKAPGVESDDSRRLEKLQDIAGTVLSRI